MKHRNTRYNCSRGAMANTRPCRGRNPGSTPGAGVEHKYTGYVTFINRHNLGFLWLMRR